jgi:hypothetical protein
MTTPSALLGTTRGLRIPWRFAAAVAAGLVAAMAVWLSVTVIAPDPIWDFGMDYRYYVSLGTRYLADGTFYLPHQLAGPHLAGWLGISPPVDTLYPPSALFLFVPLVWLPALVWWVIPIAVTGFALYRLRPAPWTWVVMLLLLAWPRAIGSYLFGNTDMWMVAALAAGLVWGWPVLLLTLKPTYVPLLLIGVRRRSAWIAGVITLVASLVLLWPLWPQYVTSMENIRGLTLDYAFGSIPLLLIPIVAWIGRRQAESVPVD